MDSITAMYPLFQAGDGGSIPTSTLHIASGGLKTMRRSVDWMMKKHYLGVWPGGAITRIFRLDQGAYARGFALYKYPTILTPVRYNVALVWELSRLWIDDSMPKNTETWFVARTIRWIKRNRPDVDALISYADPTYGHTGVIYRAGNWTADGMSRAAYHYYRIVGGKFDGKIYARMGEIPAGCEYERMFTPAKHRFVYWLRRPHEKSEAVAEAKDVSAGVEERTLELAGADDPVRLSGVEETVPVELQDHGGVVGGAADPVEEERILKLYCPVCGNEHRWNGGEILHHEKLGMLCSLECLRMAYNLVCDVPAHFPQTAHP